MSQIPCSMEYYCQNSKIMSGMDAHTRCALCRLSPDNVGRDMTHYWSPTPDAKSARKDKHPMLEAEKRNKKFLRASAAFQKKQNRDKGKMKVSRLAARAEKTTERQIIHATKNSGRRNKDGDHLSMGSITLDTKLQSTRDNPIIFLHELEKVRADAIRAGNTIGGLVIRNKHNVGCVVLKEEDYAVLTKGLEYAEQQMGCTVSGDGKANLDVVEGS